MRLVPAKLDDTGIDVGPAVVVEILDLDVRTLHRQRNQARRLRHVFESRQIRLVVAAIQVKPHRHAPSEPWPVEVRTDKSDVGVGHHPDPKQSSRGVKLR